MSKFEDYAEKYRCLAMRRENGILELRLHTDDGPFRWGKIPHVELSAAFHDIGLDTENRVIILTGTGSEFSGPRIHHTDDHWVNDNRPATPANWHNIYMEDQRLFNEILNVEVPMVAAVNGPAQRHSELALLCDVVIASTTASFEDTAHFHPGMRVPGDGLSILLLHLMGLNRARYFMFTGQVIEAQEAKDVGLVGELAAPDKLMDRAWQIARQMAEKPDLTLRYTRQILTRELKRLLHDTHGFGLALEGLAKIDLWATRGPGRPSGE